MKKQDHVSAEVARILQQQKECKHFEYDNLVMEDEEDGRPIEVCSNCFKVLHQYRYLGLYQ